ncbi:MAG: molybdopterin-synthase adenylyltransferase MoeB [Xanthomonadales bacterium]|jgi:molybdopterin/thiamine biosynthesis adenylyltransferase/rhodanese-related sulfurtransferase|nr:molybdopterin-synthase adenylyltransferase MoeB [Xanthomonadales bacterium]
MPILEVSAPEAAIRQAAGALLIDVREPNEWAAGRVADAELLPLSVLQRERPTLPGDRPLLCLCLSGLRSLRAAELLLAAGYRQVGSVRGGLRSWMAAGLPLAEDAECSGLDATARERYSRQLLLPEVGLAGQRRLQQARVLLIGAGGLGSPAALYLAAAGVGHLRLYDPDRVERSNLHRQILHGEADLDRPKVASAADRLRAMNPAVMVEAIPAALDDQALPAALAGVDVVVDGSDNLATRYRVGDACRVADIPLVYAAVERFQGQLSVFWPSAPGGPWPCYRCLYPDAPDLDATPSCAEVGVLGVVPGVLGLLQATEALKLLLVVGEPLLGRLLCVDLLRQRWRELRLPPDPDCVCQRAP